MPDRIQRRRAKGWRLPEGTIYVGRPTVFGNPFHVFPPIKPKPGGRPPNSGSYTVCDRKGRTVYALAAGKYDAHAYAVLLYRVWLTTGSVSSVARKTMHECSWIRAEIRRRLPELRGHDLACWCPLDLECHCDVLLELANSEVR